MYKKQCWPLNEQTKFSTEPYYFLDVVCKVQLMNIRGEVVLLSFLKVLGIRDTKLIRCPYHYSSCTMWDLGCTVAKNTRTQWKRPYMLAKCLAKLGPV